MHISQNTYHGLILLLVTTPTRAKKNKLQELDIRSREYWNVRYLIDSDFIKACLMMKFVADY
jgi:hypothetical protein